MWVQAQMVEDLKICSDGAVDLRSKAWEIAEMLAKLFVRSLIS
jgi:hypothetical protein